MVLIWYCNYNFEIKALTEFFHISCSYLLKTAPTSEHIYTEEYLKTYWFSCP
ncbi:hypothetical protein CLOBOL_01087 [Enterocloster bolteae ATCC BAA-613]|uniref:Uncharacterized protein n=1 Tax=Enterocloster bolteae (strain ATCC BAA-613 / DSM 15670 / CCUG 46953 / JCM 12243 / WAL 16351) TaxID=411902 RepID=A8RK02_ENTBW|nr:hypothetical protein CLOBOL_01087 [Enterocloster bolteae ATCC BAA-613]